MESVRVKLKHKCIGVKGNQARSVGNLKDVSALICMVISHNGFGSWGQN